MPGKTAILKKRKDFLRVARGVHVVTNSVIIQAALSLSENPQSWRIGYTATKKIGKAHIRNRSKRRLRAVVQEFFPTLARSDAEYVLICRQNTAFCPFKSLLRDITKGLSKINKLLDKTDDDQTTNPAD